MIREFRKDIGWFSCINLIEWIRVGEASLCLIEIWNLSVKTKVSYFYYSALEVFGIRYAVNKQLQASRQKEKEEPDIGLKQRFISHSSLSFWDSTEI